MNPDTFDYPLPKHLIAQKPLGRRDSSRLLVVDRKSGSWQDKYFSEIIDTIPAGDVLVLNNTKVFPARILGKKKETGGKVDILLLTPTADKPSVWRCLVQPSVKEGQKVLLGKQAAEAAFLTRDKDGVWLVEFPETLDMHRFYEEEGTMPLPPYVKREADDSDKKTYQTVYAEREGAVAAPTAGLHFTEELLDRLRQKGVEVLMVTLHVGYGTFKPVEDLENHQMHSESFELSAETAEKINSAKAAGKKIWAVGTTSARVLETCVRKKQLVAGQGETNLYIRPPFRFEIVDCLITNFHLPKTTLLLLVSAFMGESLVRKAYEHAVTAEYRFYSYGDAMLIV